MVANLKAEWFKLGKRPMVWVLGALLVGMVVMTGYVFLYLIMRHLSGDPANFDQVMDLRVILGGENAAVVALDSLARFGGPFALVLGAIAVGSEFGWNTVKTVLIQRSGRRDTVLGMLAAFGALLAAVVVLSVAAAILSSLIIASISDLEARPPDPASLLPAMGSAWLSLAGWTLLGALLASLFRSSALAVGLGLAYALAVENIVGLLAERVPLAEHATRAMIGHNARALVQALAPDGIDVPATAIDPWQAALALTLIILAATAAMLALQRRDYA